ncbi:TPA: hypothetical protein ACSCYS_004250 [Aeromonas veronii]
MAKQFAIKGVRGDYRFFKKTAKDCKEAFMETKPFGDTWENWLARGYSLVQVDIRVVAVVEESTKPDRGHPSPAE